MEIVIKSGTLHGEPKTYGATHDGKAIGSALVFHRDGVAFLWDIFVHEAYRRKKIASAMIEAMKVDFRAISGPTRSRNGKLLLYSCGFKKIKNNGIDTWFWEREEDAKENGAEPKKASGQEGSNGEEA